MVSSVRASKTIAINSLYGENKYQHVIKVENYLPFVKCVVHNLHILMYCIMQIICGGKPCWFQGLVEFMGKLLHLCHLHNTLLTSYNYNKNWFMVTS